MKTLQYFTAFVLIHLCMLSAAGQTLDPAPSLSGGSNQVSSIGFDYSGLTIGKSRSYFNHLGNTTQSLSWDVVNSSVWAGLSLYDRHGRPAIQTLSAPVNGGLVYSGDFMLTTTGITYGIDHFDIGNDPLQIGVSSELGNYYSDQNTLNPYQDITEYPFSRVVYSTLNPGSTKEVLGGNKIDGQWKQTYTFSMPAGTELAASAAFGAGYNSQTRVFKTVARDVHGVETVIFTDNDGNTIAAARSGNEAGNPALYTTSLTMGDQGFVDIHLPKGVTSFNITNPSGVVLEFFNLITEEVSNTISPGPGFYRIAAQDPDTYASGNAVVTISHQVNYYDYSLNYYDRTSRLTGSTQPLSPDLNTIFSYNSLGQLLETSSPDEGSARFKYRKDGQIRFSQNEKQEQTGHFSYTNYDEYGRPIQSGVYKEGNWYFDTVNPDNAGSLSPFSAKSEMNNTLYDVPDPALADLFTNSKCDLEGHHYQQRFVTGNVSKTWTNKPKTATTWYSYDALGRVEWVVQSIEGVACSKTIDYAYDSATGLIAKVDYQRYDADERFVHRYHYNEGGQLTSVFTSTDDNNFIEQASYSYSESGELIRVVLAKDLQGIDYVYNLNGQLKAINHPSLNPDYDPGQDGTAGSTIAADIFGFALDYYNGDYTRSGLPTPVAQHNTQGTDQYNGNIKGVHFNTQGFSSNGDFQSYMYQYDKNNWLGQATYGSGTLQTQGNGHSTGFTPNPQGDYQVDDLSYDANGNIQSLSRKGYTDSEGDNTMDDFTYLYNGNQLQGINDAGDNIDPERFNDLRDQGSTNYVYNELGQLVTDLQGKAFYEYNAAGLVTRVRTFSDGGNTDDTQDHILYEQDFSTATDEELDFWDIGLIGAENGISIHYSGEYTHFINHCITLENIYAQSLRLFLGNQGTYRNFDVISGIPQQFSLDVIVDQYNVLVEDGDPHENPAGYTITLYDEDDSVLATRTFNAALDYIDDPDLGGGECSRYYDNHESFTFTPTGNTVRFEIEHFKSYPRALPIYLDNITIGATTVPVMDIAYNDRGHRVKKTSYNLATGKPSYTYYVRDISGNTMGVYTKAEGSKKTPGLSEVTVYGASRLGTYSPNAFSSTGAGAYDNYRYELTDHLGNVRAVITKSGNTPVAIAKTDYYPFGMPMPNRHVDGDYRYAYQGQEKDSETGKEAFELRLWDSRIGRWLTVDPYGEFSSPYLGMGNNPISLIDPDGGATSGGGCPEPCPDDVNLGYLETVDLGTLKRGQKNSPETTGYYNTWTTEPERFGDIQYRTFDEWHAANPQFSNDPELAYDQWEVAYGEQQADFERAATQAEIELRQRELALHLMNFGRTFENISTVIGVGGFKPPKYSPRPRIGPVTPMSIKNPNSFRGVSAKQVKQHLKKHGWTGQKTNPNRVYNKGTRFTNSNLGEQIRIMPGGKNRSILIKTGPYMEISMRGTKTVIPLAGNPTLK